MNNRDSASSSTTISSHWLGWLVCIIAAIFYAYEYYLRIAPSVISDHLMHDYHVHATRIGSLFGIYYFIYAPMQLPVGVLMDKYGPRRLLTFACMVCALGSYLFVATHHFWVLLLGRAMIGFGSAFAFIGVLKLATIWLPAERFAFVAGSTAALGTVGAMVGDISLTILIEALGWRSTLFYASVFGAFLSLFIYFIVKDVSATNRQFAEDRHIDFASVLKGLVVMLKTPSMWLTGIVGCFIYLPTTAFAEAWGIGYLEHAKHLTHQDAAFGSLMVFLGFTLAAPLSGMISDKLGNRTKPLCYGGFLGAVLMAILIHGGHWVADARIIHVLLFLVGISYSVHPLVFAIGKEISPLHASGTAVAVINMFVMMGGFLVPQLIGILLDISWDFQYSDGIRVYSEAAYHFAMSAIPIGMLFGSICAWYINDEKLAEQREEHA